MKNFFNLFKYFGGICRDLLSVLIVSAYTLTALQDAAAALNETNGY